MTDDIYDLLAQAETNNTPAFIEKLKSKQDDPVYLTVLAVCYWHGWGVAEDINAATTIFKDFYCKFDDLREQPVWYVIQYYRGLAYKDGLGVIGQDKSYALSCFYMAIANNRSEKFVGLAVDAVIPLLQHYLTDDKCLQADNAELISRLGCFLFSGYGVVSDKARALKYYRAAAALGEPYAQSNLAEKYRLGVKDGVDNILLPDPKMAMHYYCQGLASKLLPLHTVRRDVDNLRGLVAATNLNLEDNTPLSREVFTTLGICYMESYGGISSSLTGERYILATAKQGDKNAQEYFLKNYKNRNDALALGEAAYVDTLEALAQQDNCHVDVLMTVGNTYLQKSGPRTENRSKAIDYFLQAAQQDKIGFEKIAELAEQYPDNLLYQSALGICYVEGWGVKDKQASGMAIFASILEKDAKQDIALFYSGSAREEGTYGYEKNIYMAANVYVDAIKCSDGSYYGKEKAQARLKKLFPSLLELGQQDDADPHVLTLIGYIYDKGLVDSINYKLSMEYFKRAGKKGDALALLNVAIYYSEGFGVHKNLAESLKYYCQALELQKLDKKAAKKVFNAIVKLMTFYKGMEKLSAQAVEGMCYLSGHGTATDKPRGIALLETAANAGCEKAQYYLALAYEQGNGAEADIDEAITWYQAAAMHKTRNKNGTVNAIERLKALDAPISPVKSEEIDYLLTVAQERESGFKRIQKLVAAKPYDADYRSALAACYFEGWGVQPDINQAMDIFTGYNNEIHTIEPASDIADFYIAQVYENGRDGYEKNLALAIRHYVYAVCDNLTTKYGAEKARARLMDLIPPLLDNPKLSELDTHILNGISRLFHYGYLGAGEENYKKAFAYAQASAQKQDPYGLFNLAIYHVNGHTDRGIKNISAAIHYYCEALELQQLRPSTAQLAFNQLEKLMQNPPADIDVHAVRAVQAICYLYGHGVKQDIKKARELFSAAQLRNRKAKYYLGLMHEQGLGCQPNIALALSSYYCVVLQKLDLPPRYKRKIWDLLLSLQEDPVLAYQSKNLMGICYYRGDYVDNNYQLAIEHMLAAYALKPSSDVIMTNLGVMYTDAGNFHPDIEPDYATGAEWLWKSIKCQTTHTEGSPQAIRVLKQLCEKHKDSADLKYAPLFYVLGRYHYEILKDNNAVKYIAKAASMGHSDATVLYAELMHKAIIMQDYQIVEDEFNTGVKLELVDVETGNSFLHALVLQANKVTSDTPEQLDSLCELIKKLLEKDDGSYLTYKNYGQRMPIDLAISPRVRELLFSHAETAGYNDPELYQASVYRALLTNDFEAACRLINKGGNPDYVSGTNDTIFHHWARSPILGQDDIANCMEFIDAWLSRYSQAAVAIAEFHKVVFIKNLAGHTAFEVAMQNKNFAFIEALCQKLIGKDAAEDTLYCQLGDIYYDSVNPNLEKAAYYYLLAAKTNASNDSAKAFKQLEMLAASSQDSTITALYNVGLCHEFGYGTPKNVEIAEQYYRRIIDIMFTTKSNVECDGSAIFEQLKNESITDLVINGDFEKIDILIDSRVIFSYQQPDKLNNVLHLLVIKANSELHARDQRAKKAIAEAGNEEETVEPGQASNGFPAFELLKKLLSLPGAATLIEQTNANYLTPIEFANHREIILQFVEVYKSDVNDKAHYSKALYAALLIPDIIAAERLEEAGASLECTDNCNNNIFHVIVKSIKSKEFIPILNQYVKFYASVLPGGSSGESKNSFVANLILAKNDNGETALDIAVALNHSFAVKAFCTLLGWNKLHLYAYLGRPDLITKSMENKNALIVKAMALDDKEKIAALEKEYDPKAKDFRGKSPIKIAGDGGKWPCILPMFAKKGKLTELEEQHLGEVLYWAVLAAEAETAKGLLALGAPIELRSSADAPEQEPLFHTAVRTGHIDTVKVVLSYMYAHKSKLNELSYTDETALEIAIRAKDLKMVQLLSDYIKSGHIDAQVTNKQGKTASKIARELFMSPTAPAKLSELALILPKDRTEEQQKHYEALRTKLQQDMEKWESELETVETIVTLVEAAEEEAKGLWKVHLKNGVNWLKQRLSPQAPISANVDNSAHIDLHNNL